MPKKIFLFSFFAGIDIGLFSLLDAAFEWVCLSEESLIRLSYLWVFLIGFGIHGLLHYNRVAEEESPYRMPLILGLCWTVGLWLFFEVFWKMF